MVQGSKELHNDVIISSLQGVIKGLLKGNTPVVPLLIGFMVPIGPNNRCSKPVSLSIKPASRCTTVYWSLITCTVKLPPTAIKVYFFLFWALSLSGHWFSSDLSFNSDKLMSSNR